MTPETWRWQRGRPPGPDGLDEPDEQDDQQPSRGRPIEQIRADLARISAEVDRLNGRLQSEPESTSDPQSEEAC